MILVVSAINQMGIIRLILTTRPTLRFDRGVTGAPSARAPDRSRSRPRDDIVRCGEGSTTPHRAGHGAPAPRGHTRSRSAGSGNAARSRATPDSDIPGWAGSGAGRALFRHPILARPIARHLVCSPGAPWLAGDPCKGSGQLAQQTIERACQDHRPRNEDIIVARLSGAGQQLPGGLHKAAARPIASDGVADSAAGRKAQADLRAPPRRRTRPDLENKGRRHPAASAGCDREELLTPPQTRDRRLRLALVTQADAGTVSARSAGQPLATPGAPAGDHPAAANGRHARAKTVAPLANDVARLIGALHAGPLYQPKAKPVRCIGRAREAVKPMRAPTACEAGERDWDQCCL
jgi:hypothetical protein